MPMEVQQLEDRGGLADPLGWRSILCLHEAEMCPPSISVNLSPFSPEAPMLVGPVRPC